MSGGSSSAGGWFTRLEPVERPGGIIRRADDPRLGEIVESWQGDPAALRPGRAVLLGFPQDEGVRRNHGRAGAAEAPNTIRAWLYGLTPWDGASDVDLTVNPPLDVGNVRIAASLEQAQEALAEVVGGILRSRAVPVVLGGGHETAYGHYLGYLAAGRDVGVINLDAHLDVRPWVAGQGHSGSPFRQALEHPVQPLRGERYVCLGAQPQSVSRAHWFYARERGCVVRWCGEVSGSLEEHFRRQCERLAASGCHVYVSVDADVVCAAEVPGVSTPNPLGLAGREVIACTRRAGSLPGVSSFDLVEINPGFDRDGQSARWAALAVWHFLVGLATRPAGWE